MSEDRSMTLEEQVKSLSDELMQCQVCMNNVTMCRPKREHNSVKLSHLQPFKSGSHDTWLAH